MKASFAALALSFVGAAFAAPATQAAKRQDAQHPYSIGGISLRHLTEDNSYVFISYVTQYSNSSEAQETTTCQTSWNPSVPAGPENPQSCADPNFTFWFPTGVSNLENYEVTVTGPVGQGTTTIVAGPSYECGTYEGTIAGIDYECHTAQGAVFLIPVA
ncbi:hypothetical protein BDW59DRAFT_144147 [Aspergillus cavernicola]|uniref:AA1-like domain-containing protein n=1 Tax=Aspergillus cavernicola TaxID=176166 RepID=A0ABR4IHX8_9EURO